MSGPINMVLLIWCYLVGIGTTRVTFSRARGWNLNVLLGIKYGSISVWRICSKSLSYCPSSKKKSFYIDGGSKEVSGPLHTILREYFWLCTLGDHSWQCSGKTTWDVRIESGLIICKASTFPTVQSGPKYLIFLIISFHSFILSQDLKRVPCHVVMPRSMSGCSSK